MAINKINSKSIEDLQISADDLASGSISTAKLADGAVTTAKIVDANITAGKLADGAVTTAKIVDSNITAGKLASGAAVSNIGYTPANKAGETFTGNVTVSGNRIELSTAGNTELYTSNTASGANVRGGVQALTNQSLRLGTAGNSTAVDIEIVERNVVLASFTASGGYLRLASGTGGIQFNGDTAAANALDDYEEGTWTPALGTNTTTTYSNQTGWYKKIGNTVYLYFSISLSNKGDISGSYTRIAGLPFSTAVAGAARFGGGHIHTYRVGSAVNIQGVEFGGGIPNQGWITTGGGSTVGYLNTSFVADNSYFEGFGMYRTE